MCLSKLLISNGLPAGPAIAQVDSGGGEMKYMVAWALGIPGSLIVLWFLLNQTGC